MPTADADLPEPPVAKYRLTVKVTGNSHDEIESALLSLSRGHYLLMSDYHARDEWNSTNGTTSMRMEHTNPDQTPEKYAAELATWWEARKAARREADHA